MFAAVSRVSSKTKKFRNFPKMCYWTTDLGERSRALNYYLPIIDRSPVPETSSLLSSGFHFLVSNQVAS